MRKSKRSAISQMKREIVENDDGEQSEQQNQDNGAQKNEVDKNWTDLETIQFLELVFKQLEDKEHITCSRRIALLDWKKVKVGNKSEKECIAYIKQMVADIPRHRTLGEVLEVFKNQRFDKETIEKLIQQATPDPDETNNSIKQNQKLPTCMSNPVKEPTQNDSEANNNIAKKSKKGGAVKATQEMTDPTCDSKDASLQLILPIKREPKPEKGGSKKSKKGVAITAVTTVKQELIDPLETADLAIVIPEPSMAIKRKQRTEESIPQKKSKSGEVSNDDIVKKSKKAGGTTEPKQETTAPKQKINKKKNAQKKKKNCLEFEVINSHHDTDDDMV